MKRFYDLQCDDCGIRVEKWVSFEAIPETPCPRCGKKGMRKLVSPFAAGSSCKTGRPRFRG
jgi:putative FmdB family regulatory protein